MFNCSSSRVRWHVIWIRKTSCFARELARQGRWINQPIWQIMRKSDWIISQGLGWKLKNEIASELGISNQFFQSLLEQRPKLHHYTTISSTGMVFSVKKLFLFEKYGQHAWRIFTPKGWYRGHPSPNIGLFIICLLILSAQFIINP